MAAFFFANSVSELGQESGISYQGAIHEVLFTRYEPDYSALFWGLSGSGTTAVPAGTVK